jgi:hypothetical protein
MLVDPELAELARELLREPDEAGGKGGYMSALGTHEISSGMSLGLEPPLSPPVVRSPMASAMPTGDGLAGLPTPPPAIRPPESATPPPAPAVHAEVPQQPEPAPAPPVLPAVAPAQEPEAPIHDYFAAEASAAQELPAGAPAPVEEPDQTVELNAVPLAAPAAPVPVEEPEPVELPTMTPLAATPEPAPAALVTPVELPLMAPQASVAPAPAPEPEPEPAAAPEPVEPSLPELEPAAVVETEPAPAPTRELEELFAPMPTQQSAFSVVVRLRDGDGVEVGSFRDFGTAMEGAQEVIEQFSTATEGQWPFYAGRFIRPDLIVSVDVVETDAV